MPSTAITTWQDGIEGKLLTAVTTATTTGITFKIKQINGATPTCPTAAFRLKVVQKTALNTKVEKWGVAAGTTQSGQTVTLGTVTRALSLTDGTTFAASGTAQAFAAGADVFLTWDNQDAGFTAKLDLAQTFTGVNTFASGLIMSATDKAFVPPTVTTTQRDAIASPTNGMIVYNSTTGVMNQYIGGAWTAFASGTTVAAANNTSGKVDVATLVEIAAGTATDASSGALNALVVGNTKLTSAGAGDSGGIPALNTAGLIAAALLGTSPTSGKYLLGNNTWSTVPVTAEITAQAIIRYTGGDASLSSASFADVDGTNLTTTVATTTANTILLIWVEGFIGLQATTNQVTFDISVGGTAVGGTGGLLTVTGLTNMLDVPLNMFAMVKPGAGSNIVVKPRYKTAAGTHVFNADSGTPAAFYVLKIEPSA